MRWTFRVLAIIVLFMTVGCSNAVNEKEEVPSEIKTAPIHFTGTIKEIKSNTAIVYAQLGGGEGEVFVNLSVNSDETFQAGDKVKVGYDGVIAESYPAQIKTLSVELIDE